MGTSTSPRRQQDPQGLSGRQAPSSVSRPPTLRGKAQPPSFPVSGLFMSYEFSYVNKGGPARGGGPHPHLFPLPLPSAPHCVHTFQVCPHPHIIHSTFILSHLFLLEPNWGQPEPTPRLPGLHPTETSSGKQGPEGLSEDHTAGMTFPVPQVNPTSRKNL